MLFLLYLVSTESESDGDVQVLMGRMISTLQDLYSFVLRCYDVVRNTVQQLSALHSNTKYNSVCFTM